MTADHRSEDAVQSLERAKQNEPELAAYYQFYQCVFQLQNAAGDAITGELELADPEILQNRFDQWLPQISFDQLPVAPVPFKQLSLALLDAIFEYQGDGGGEFDYSELDWVGFAREYYEKKPRPSQPSLLEVAAGLATEPYLEWASAQVAPHLDVAHWHKGRCPVCGGEPYFAYLETKEGSRWLICSRCRAEWRHKRMICPFCDNNRPNKLKYYPAGENGSHRVYVCDACFRYLRAVDLRLAKSKINLRAEPVLSWSLDKAAREKGYF